MKQLTIVAVLLLSSIKSIHAQKKGHPIDLCDNVKPKNSFEMSYPLDMEQASIATHYGKSYIDTRCYFNEGLTFTTKLNSTVTCNVDEATVSSVSYDDGMYIVFLKKDNYTIAFCNLKKAKVKKGDTVKLGDVLGTLAPHEEDHQKGCLELMLFEGNKICNPEKYMINSLSLPAISTVT